MIDKEKQWEENVKEAKIAFRSREHMQMKIAKLALQVCEITWGGANKSEFFTLERFAKESGISYKSISSWIAVKKNVYDKLDSEHKAQASYTSLHLTARFVTKSWTSEQVQKKFKEMSGINSIDAKMLRYCQILRAVAHNFEMKDTALKCKDNTIEEIAFYCDLILKNMRANFGSVNKKDHGLAGKYSLKNGTLAARAVHGDKIGETFVTDEDGFRVRMSAQDQRVLDAIKGHKDFIGPSMLGKQIYRVETNASKLKTLRSLGKLLSVGLLERNSKGFYKYKGATK